jgi:hypothetical protein
VTASSAETILNRNQIKREEKGQIRELAPLVFESKRAQLFFPFLFFPPRYGKESGRKWADVKRKRKRKKEKTWC